MNACEERETVDGAREDGGARGVVERRVVVGVVSEQACRLLQDAYSIHGQSSVCSRERDSST